jgi:hypothetical protein
MKTEVLPERAGPEITAKTVGSYEADPIEA